MMGIRTGRCQPTFILLLLAISGTSSFGSSHGVIMVQIMSLFDVSSTRIIRTKRIATRHVSRKSGTVEDRQGPRGRTKKDHRSP